MAVHSGKILVVDDDEFVLLSLKLFLEQHFQTVRVYNDPKKIPAAFEKDNFDVVLLDMNFKSGDTSGKEGMHWLTRISELSNETQVILMTAYAEVNIAVQAIKLGAIDFMVKPWENDKVLTTVTNAFALSKEKKKVLQLTSRQKAITSAIDNQFTDIIGESEVMKAIFKTIEKVSSTDADVLILGDNGTGKEVIARAIHRQSARADEVFISVDLGSISEALFESELFGHKKGAFTDAKEDRIGRIEAAQGGTLFLDEIGNLSSSLQAKMLTVLQHKKITRVGTNLPIDVDVRVICATNSNLVKLVADGKFREDLLYRINTVEIKVPSLKERAEDIVPLTQHFLYIFSRKYQKQFDALDSQVIKKIEKYKWPGNVRELQHAIERAVIMNDTGQLTPQDFHFLSSTADEEFHFENYHLEKVEAWAIRNSIHKHKGNISHAALELGLSRGALYRRMQKYGI